MELHVDKRQKIGTSPPDLTVPITRKPRGRLNLVKCNECRRDKAGVSARGDRAEAWGSIFAV